MKPTNIVHTMVFTQKPAVRFFELLHMSGAQREIDTRSGPVACANYHHENHGSKVAQRIEGAYASSVDSTRKNS
jgi:hypothetical protein